MSRFGDVQQFIELSKEVQSPADLQGLMDGITREMGFDHFALIHHVDLTPFDTRLDHMEQGEMIALITYPNHWIEHYIANDIVSNDPILIASQRTAVGFAWSEVPKLIEETPAHRKITAQTRKAGILNGYTVPANVPGEANGSANFAMSRTDQLPGDNLHMAQLVGSFAFQAARDLVHRAYRAMKLEMPRLTSRQLECLALAGRGKSDWEIATILGISESTAKEHIKLACQKYDVPKRVQAVMRAVFDGQLTLRDVVH